MLTYAISVMKEVLSRPELDDTVIYFYTYDDSLHEYDFQGEEPERTVLDFSLKPTSRPPDYFLNNIRVFHQ